MAGPQSPDEINPLGNPPNQVSREQVKQMEDKGGRGTTQTDSPAFMRKEERNINKLPLHDKSSSPPTKN